MSRELTTREKQSDAAKRIWRIRKRTLEARGSMHRLPSGVERVKNATTPFKTSVVIAKELGVSPAYVRKCWAEMGQQKRPGGRPPKGSALSSGSLDA